MQSILEDLYNGNIQFNIKHYEPNAPYVQAARLKAKNYEKLEAALNASEKELFEKYLDAQSELEDISRYDTFTCALKFSVLMMMEVMGIRERELMGLDE